MNKKIIALLLCVIMATSVAMTACQPAANPTTNKPATTAPTTQPTEPAPTVPTVKDVTVKITVKNDNGALVPDVEMRILPNGSEEGITAKTDANGYVEVTLKEGEYTIRYEMLPGMHVGEDTALSVKEGMEAVTLELIDGTPDGSEDKPYLLVGENAIYSFAAGQTLHFSIRAGEGHTIQISGYFVEVNYEGLTYTPNPAGIVELKLSSGLPSDTLNFSITNKGEEAVELELVFVQAAADGTFENPIVIENLGEFTALCMGWDFVYYTYEATQDGVFVFTCDDENNYTVLENRNTYAMTEAEAGLKRITIDVKAGEVICVQVSAYNEVEGGDEITFTVTME